MNLNLRHGAYILFVLILAGINFWLKWMSFFEYLLIACFAMIIIKLTDIEEKLR